jgi:hypothetical protein
MFALSLSTETDSDSHGLSSSNSSSSSSSIPMQQLHAGRSGAAAPFTSPAEVGVIMATCCLQRATSSRKENYFYTMGKKAGWYV